MNTNTSVRRTPMMDELPSAEISIRHDLERASEKICEDQQSSASFVRQ
ncbi:MAG: hypothetical protein J6A58_14375 [Oscillospiraceae bacterium]|nr:hypothetical protein [Oscillospiraceae bacterium]